MKKWSDKFSRNMTKAAEWLQLENDPAGVAEFNAICDELKKWVECMERLQPGLGTGLKPARETWWLARRPVQGTILENVVERGTGALRIDDCRIERPAGDNADEDRFPANLILGEAVDAALAPYFFCPKPSRREREFGCEALPKKTGAEAVGRKEDSAGVRNPRAGAGRTAEEVANAHPTVKSVALMRYLCRLVTPRGGIVLDPFCGSGTTGMGALAEGLGFIGIEQSGEYLNVAHARISAVQQRGWDDDGGAEPAAAGSGVPAVPAAAEAPKDVRAEDDG